MCCRQLTKIDVTGAEQVDVTGAEQVGILADLFT